MLNEKGNEWVSFSHCFKLSPASTLQLLSRFSSEFIPAFPHSCCPALLPSFLNKNPCLMFLLSMSPIVSFKHQAWYFTSSNKRNNTLHPEHGQWRKEKKIWCHIKVRMTHSENENEKMMTVRRKEGKTCEVYRNMCDGQEQILVADHPTCFTPQIWSRLPQLSREITK